MATTGRTHPSVEDRRARGKDARVRAAVSGHAGWVPAADRPDPIGLLRGAERDPRGGSGAGAPRPDDGLAVHLLPGRGEDHGRRSGGHADRRAERAAVRGCAPVEFRGLRLAGAGVGVRPQRLRRDTAGAVRVRREADGGQLHHRGPQQRRSARPTRGPRRSRR